MGDAILCLLTVASFASLAMLKDTYAANEQLK